MSCTALHVYAALKLVMGTLHDTQVNTANGCHTRQRFQFHCSTVTQLTGGIQLNSNAFIKVLKVLPLLLKTLAVELSPGAAVLDHSKGLVWYQYIGPKGQLALLTTSIHET